LIYAKLECKKYLESLIERRHNGLKGNKVRKNFV